MTHHLHHRDALAVLAEMQTATVDAIVTDPPYSSGGMTRGDRSMNTNSKYANTEQQGDYADFAGDNRDQRAWGYWMTLWLGEALRVTKPGGIIEMFCDWRQLPTATDAMQSGGWVWRGIVPWNKTEGVRPQKGRFRQQCEYVVWGSAGPMENEGACLPGFYTYVVKPGEKFHLTGKPVPLMVDLLKMTKPGAVILDPFMGSGSTGVACQMTGRQFIGCEKDPHYYAVAEKRIREAALQPGLLVMAAEEMEQQGAMI